MHSGSVVQYGKIKEADSIKLLAFPKPGASFDRWLDHAVDAVSAATTYVNEAFKWIRMIKKSDTTFEMLADSGNFLRLDAILLTALMECIPGDTHYLRQEIKKAKTLQQDTKELNITGRQVLFLVYHFFSMSEKDRNEVLDSIPLHRMPALRECVDPVLFLASEAASYITGVVLDINGGRFMSG